MEFDTKCVFFPSTHSFQSDSSKFSTLRFVLAVKNAIFRFFLHSSRVYAIYTLSLSIFTELSLCAVAKTDTSSASSSSSSSCDVSVCVSIQKLNRKKENVKTYIEK